MIYNVIWYILLPFVVSYRKIKQSVKDMSDNQRIAFWLLILIVLCQLYEIFTYLSN